MKQNKVKSPNREELKKLVGLIGGPERLSVLLQDFYARMEHDILIGFFFTGHDLKHIAEMQSQFILMAAGLIPRFEGKGPSTAHVALPPILQGHFDRRLVILRETLRANQVDPALIETWVRFEESFRLVVVSEEIQHHKKERKKGAPET